MSIDQLIGLGGGLLGCVIGLAGGLIGTYFSIKRTNGPKERAFMIKFSLLVWLAIGLFIVLRFVLPTPYDVLLWIPYCILLPAGILYFNRAQQRIRKEEAAPPPQ